jgi:hypothetical protein
MRIVALAAGCRRHHFSVKEERRSRSPSARQKARLVTERLLEQAQELTKAT